MATDIIARGMITEYKSGTNIDFTENEDGSVTISASGDVSSEDTVAREIINNHKLNKNNPHNVTAEQIGLNNVDNTADLDKPISTAVQTALDNKANIKHTHKKSDITDFPNSLPADGGNADTVNNHTVGTDVPTDAVFTDTVYDDTEIDNRIKNNADDISQLFDITKGGESVTGNSSYTIENTVDYPIMGINVYGKSTQNGTPTPDAPIDIVSVGDNGNVDVMACGKNLLNFNKDSITLNGITFTKNSDGTYTLNGTATAYTYLGVYCYVEIGKTYKLLGCPSGGSSTTYDIAENGSWKRDYGNGAIFTAATNPFYCSINIQADTVLDNVVFKPMVTTDLTANYDDFEPYKGNTASITSSLPLCGIPVSSGGNYTDSNGQQWVCDELIYNADGTGKIIKNIGKIIFDGSEDWSKSGVAEIDRYILRNVSAKKGIRITSGLCNTYIVDVSETSDTELGKILLYPSYYDQISINFAEYGTSTVETFKDYLKNNPIVLYTDLIEPQEIELTAVEVDALRTLQTFNGTTSISNSSGAEMSVKYCTNKALSEFVRPVTMGLQKQIDELRAAILSMGGNV